MVHVLNFKSSITQNLEQAKQINLKLIYTYMYSYIEINISDRWTKFQSVKITLIIHELDRCVTVRIVLLILNSNTNSNENGDWNLEFNYNIPDDKIKWIT